MKIILTLKLEKNLSLWDSAEGERGIYKLTICNIIPRNALFPFRSLNRGQNIRNRMRYELGTVLQEEARENLGSCTFVGIPLVSAVMNLRSSVKCGEILDWLQTS